MTPALTKAITAALAEARLCSDMGERDHAWQRPPAVRIERVLWHADGQSLAAAIAEAQVAGELSEVPGRSTFWRVHSMRCPRRVLMHVCDASCPEDGGVHQVRFQCPKCQHATEWVTVKDVTEGRRGSPCPKCNEGK